MGTLRFTDLRTRPTEVLDLTSLTVNEFEPLASPFEAAFQAHMALWRLDGQATHRPTVHDRQELSVAHARGPSAVYPGLPEDLSPPGRTRAAVRDGPEPSASVDPRAPGGAASGAAHAGGDSDPVCGRAGSAPGRG
jgi:hypothetical protein